MTERDDSHGDGIGDDDGDVTTHRWDEGDGDPARSVIEAVAAVTGANQTELRPLYDVVDPEALDALFATDARRSGEHVNGYVTFEYEGCEVTVHADGRTVVESTPMDDS